MKKIQYNGSSKILNGIVTKVNLIIDKLVVDVKVNGTSVVVVNEEGEREADIDLSLADQNVKQSPTTDNKDYRVLLSKSDNDTEETDIARKNTDFKYNPSTGNLQTTKLNGNTVPSGSGNDTLAKLSDIPSIPTVNDNTITLQQNGTTVDSFTLNQNTDKSININAAVNNELMTEDLNDVRTVGFYVGKSSNTCTNKPSGVNQFGLYVVKLGTSNQYFKQILIQAKTVANGGSKAYSRALYQTTWTDWVEEKYTDEKVKQTEITDDKTVKSLAIASDNTTTTDTDGVEKCNGLAMRINKNQHSGSVNSAELYIGNNIAVGSVDNYVGVIRMFGTDEYFTSIHAGNSTANREIVFPDADGTVALTSDITSAINDLDVASTSISASKTLATIKEEDGKVSVTTQDISIKSNQIENYCMVGTASSISSGVTWYKVASTTLTVANDDAIIMFAVQDAYIPDTDSTSDSNGGILYCRVRQGSPVGTHNYGKLKFVANSGLDVNNFRLYYTTSASGITYEIWTSMNRRYAFRKFVVLSQSNRYQATTEKWTLYNTTSPTSAPTESATCVRIECEDNTYKQTDNNLLGSKNLLKYPYYSDSYTSNGITWTLNADGTVTAKGTATANSQFYLHTRDKSEKNDFILPNGTYILSDGGLKNINTEIQMGITRNGAWSEIGYTRNGDVQFTANGDDYSADSISPVISLLVRSGQQNVNVTFKPMIRLATIADNTYVPYAQTNKQLTTNKVDYNDYGVKNLIPYPWSRDAFNGRVNRGITFTYNEEGYVTLNGTAYTSSQPYFCYTLATDEAAQLGNALVVESGKKYTLSIDRTDNRLFSLVLIRNTSGTEVNIDIRAVYEDGSVREATTNYVSLALNGVMHSSVTFEFLTAGSYRLQTDLRVNNNSGSYTNARARVIIKEAYVSDNTWTKYAKNNYELTTQKFDWSAQNLVGSKNVLPYPYTEIYDSGLTVVYNKDGSVKVSCASQSATKLIRLQNRGQNTKLWLDSTRRYKMSCVTDKKSTASKSCGISLLYYNGSTSVQSVSAYANVSDMVILPSVTANLIECYLFVPANTVIDNETFYPMVRNAEVTDNTWMPYADTNRNLSMNKADVSQIATVEWTNTASKAYEVGEYMIWRGYLHRVIASISSGGTITLNTNVYSTSIGNQLRWKASSVSANEIQVKTTDTNIASGNASEIVIEEIRLYADSGVINNWFSCYRHIPLYNAVGYYKDCEFSWWDGNDFYYASISITKSGNYIIATCDAAKQGSRDITTYSDFKMYITVSEKS